MAPLPLSTPGGRDGDDLVGQVQREAPDRLGKRRDLRLRVPVCRGEELVGVVETCHVLPRPFSKRHRQMLEGIGRLAFGGGGS